MSDSSTPKYSICITQRNNLETMRASLESILGQINQSYEVVVVDGESSELIEWLLVLLTAEVAIDAYPWVKRRRL